LASNNSLLKELTDFLNELESYAAFRSRQHNHQNITNEEVSKALLTRDILLEKIGPISIYVNETGFSNGVRITRNGNIISVNMWNEALKMRADEFTIPILEDGADTIKKVIGQIKDDIGRSKRDENGYLIKPKLTDQIPKIFISHGKQSDALDKMERFLRNLGVDPLIVKNEANKDSTVDDKVNNYLEESDCVVILATGDDLIDGKLHPRQNVIHEIGLAQASHPGKVIYLLENTAEFPSNIRPKVWEGFTQDNMEAAFQRIVIELRELGILKAIKPNTEK
jgi:predicted nucleotide-binding protein